MNSDEATLKAVQALWRRTISTEAKADGIAAAVLLLAKKVGVPQEAIVAAIEQATAASKQRQLERVEDQSPGLAAEMDDRPAPPDEKREPPTNH